MANTKALIGVFTDEQDLLQAVKALKKSNFNILECFTPFPVHGLDKVLGYKASKLDIVAFAFGTMGMSLALLMQIYMMHIDDWQWNIGGKPTLSLPAFIPITFEVTVLLAALGMVGTFLVISKLIPGAEHKIYHQRQTSDRFILVVAEDSMTPEITEIMNTSGAEEVYDDVFEPAKLPTPIKEKPQL